jgi:hypothetical protein
VEEIDLLDNRAELAEVFREGGFSIAILTSTDAEICDESTGNTFFLHGVESWVQLKCIYFTPEQVASAVSMPALVQSLLLIHFRLLGCRFAIDEDSAIWLLEDTLAVDATPSRLVRTLRQLQFIIDATLASLHAVVASGVALNDLDLDTIFELQTMKDAGSTH